MSKRASAFVNGQMIVVDGRTGEVAPVDTSMEVITR